MPARRAFRAPSNAAPAGSASRSLAHRHLVRVYWEDTDAGGVVYYANYLKFFERARTEWLRGLGFSQEALRRDVGTGGTMFVVTHASVRHLAPARLDDLLEITVDVRHAGRASLVLAQQALASTALPAGGTLLAEGEIRIGCVDAGTFRPARIPNEVLRALT